MGDIKKQKKKYSAPEHPWQKERIEKEKELSREYGLVNKKEIWKMNSMIRSFQRQAKKNVGSRTEQSQKEWKLLVEKLNRLGLVGPDATLDDILSLTVKEILERRLQTLVWRKTLAHSAKQARQFITHRHIMVGNRKVTVPSYIVPREEEQEIHFADTSALTDPEHPERNLEAQQAKKEEAEKAQAAPEQPEAPKEEEKPAEAEATPEAQA